MNRLLKKAQAYYSDYWSTMYQKHGDIWGEKPSSTAKYAISILPNSSKIFEIGYGYGRDLIYLEKQGHETSGIEISLDGYEKTINNLTNHKAAIKNILVGEFTNSTLPKNHYDAIISHRVIHLIDDNDIESFATQCAHILEPNGLLCISSRDARGFNKNTMNMIKNGVAEYKDRPDHIINFWDEERFIKAFRNHFTIKAFKKSNEIESLRNPVATPITTMIAYKNDI